MKQINNISPLLLLLFLFFVSSCRKAATEVIEESGLKKVGTEIIERIGTKEIKNEITENLLKKTIKELSESGLSKESSNIILKEFDEDLILKFSKDIAENPSFLKLINENPALVSGYKKLQEFPQFRLNSSYLSQTQHWITKGSKGRLILDIPNKININKKLKNTTFKGVSFVEKTIIYKKIGFRGVFPDFNKQTIFTTSLPKKYYSNNDNSVFEICKNALRKEYEKDTKKFIKMLKENNKGKVYTSNGIILNEREMLDKQIKDILQENSGIQKGRIFGFTWHHNEATGRMDLVDYNIHKEVKHLGGNYIWGGGSSTRK